MQSSEFLPVPCPHPLCPSKSSPSLQALSLISGPKGQARCCWGLGCPTLPCLCPASCKSMGMSHQALASCSGGGDLAALPPLPWGGEMKYRQSNPSVVALIPPHCSQALGRGARMWTGIKVQAALVLAGGGVTLQRYQSALPHFRYQYRRSFLDNKVVRKRMEHTFPLSLSSRWHLQGMMPCQVPPALKGVFAEPSALSWNGGD